MNPGSFSSSSSFNQKRKSLAERIANSTCRKCGQSAHWRRECPLNDDRDKEKTNFTGLAMASQQDEIFNMENTEVVDQLPEDATLIGRKIIIFCFPGKNSSFEGHDDVEIGGNIVCRCFHVNVPTRAHDFETLLSSKLSKCCRNHIGARADAAAVASTLSDFSHAVDNGGTGTKRDSSFSTADCLFNSEEDIGEAIIDTGASRAVIGELRLKGMLESLPDSIRRMPYRARTPGVVFKFQTRPN